MAKAAYQAFKSGEVFLDGNDADLIKEEIIARKKLSNRITHCLETRAVPERVGFKRGILAKRKLCGNIGHGPYGVTVHYRSGNTVLRFPKVPKHIWHTSTSSFRGRQPGIGRKGQPVKN